MPVWVLVQIPAFCGWLFRGCCYFLSPLDNTACKYSGIVRNYLTKSYPAFSCHVQWPAPVEDAWSWNDVFLSGGVVVGISPGIRRFYCLALFTRVPLLNLYHQAKRGFTCRVLQGYPSTLLKLPRKSYQSADSPPEFTERGSSTAQLTACNTSRTGLCIAEGPREKCKPSFVCPRSTWCFLKLALQSNQPVDLVLI
jgi:hypothetical protein